MKINSTIFFTISSLLYSSLLMIAYFSKDRIKTPENKIYSRLIIINFIGIILEIFCTIFAGYAKENIIFYIILNKLFLIGLIVWGAVFGSYVFLISSVKKNEEELKKYMKNVLRLYITLIIIIAVLVAVLPVYFNYRNNYVMYSYGPAVNVVYSGIFITIFLTIICLIKNFKNIISKKYLPIYAYLFVGTIITFIQKMMPELLLAITMDTFITVIMYFTIENPDKKLLQEIHASKKMADEANEEKSMLIYNMMGEIKDIAKDINISSNNILDSNNIEENKYYAREIISSNNKLYNMSDKIYNIDKIELNKIKTVKTKYNIKLLLKEIVSMYKTKIEAKNIEFRINIDNNLPVSLYGDSINLKKALSTIIDSSYNNTKEGFIELSVNTIIKHDVCRLIIKIEDSSIGIKTEEIEELNTEGNIYNAKKLIAALGGTLLLTSRYNEGTIVTIILDQKINITNKKEKKDYTKYLDNKKILLVDDNESSLKLINKILTKYHIKVETTNLGKKALDKIRKGSKYDLILLDEEMPYMNGEEVLKKLKEIKGFNTKVLLLTKNNNIEYTEEYKENNFDDYILKPIDKNTLIEKINILVNDKKYE